MHVCGLVSEHVYMPVDENPNCLQATFASFVPQKLSQTVPHVSLTQISTRPSSTFVPLTSLISPSVQSAYTCIGIILGMHIVLNGVNNHTLMKKALEMSLNMKI